MERDVFHVIKVEEMEPRRERRGSIVKKLKFEKSASHKSLPLPPFFPFIFFKNIVFSKFADLIPEPFIIHKAQVKTFPRKVSMSRGYILHIP